MRALRWSVERLWLVAGLIALWEVGTRAAGASDFPPPSQIVKGLYELWFSGPASRGFLTEQAVDDFSTSLGNLFVGWILAGLVGVLLGVLVGRSAVLNELLDPVMQFARAIPPATLLPFFIVVFQLGTTMQIVTIAFGVVWPVLLNTTDGVRSVERLYLETARVFNISAARRMTTIILPAAAPKIFAGLRVSLSFALILMVLAELTGSTSGLGARIINAQRAFEMTQLWAGIVMLGVLGCLFNGLFALLEKRLLAWHSGIRRLTT
ncbi:ABC transporter permease [Actinomadura kijaniata]|uniref:ABC transporter permease n=1 Tax=Actinomadura kijaniata TaxID=46161 RepID=UPI0008322E31|nr:ABC transporter permease [Actinomadura kijaniata]